ncbi:hypothetical protein BOX15_Mlig033056g5 [Macrostomum lignano]|nr:hypothetical protein BOX15_Mlig033056g5 [Macrostomum lignano]
MRCWMRNRCEEAQLQRRLAVLETQRQQAWLRATREADNLMLKARQQTYPTQNSYMYQGM